jgi:hypothetical protein
MSKQKLTKWFPADVKPARPGVYNVSCLESGQSGKWYALFDGQRWSWKWDTDAASDVLHEDGNPSDWYLGSWRGLASHPKDA